MKKKFLSLILCFCLIFAPIFFSGCNKGYTKEDISNLFVSMKTNEKTKDFFNGNTLVVNFNSVADDVNSKGYIFSAVYNYYLNCSSYLFVNVVNKYDKIDAISDAVSYSIKDFSTEQIADIYNKLSVVNNNLKTFYDSKSVYEITNEELHYKELLHDYNNLIVSLYNFNFSFADYYFGGVGHVDFSNSQTELSDSNIREMLCYILLNLSKVTFNYEVLNYTPSNPLGEVKNSFINKTEYMKDFLNVCDDTISSLNNTNDLALTLLSNKNKVKSLFENMQKGDKRYKVEYNLFLKTLNNFDLKNYLIATNKNAFLENSSLGSKSNFEIIKNFLTNYYKAYLNGLDRINSYF